MPPPPPSAPGPRPRASGAADPDPRHASCCLSPDLHLHKQHTVNTVKYNIYYTVKYNIFVRYILFTYMYLHFKTTSEQIKSLQN